MQECLREKRKILFQAYCDEMNAIADAEIWSEQDRVYGFIDYQTDMFEWHDIAGEAGEPVGFVVMAKSPNCHPDTDRFIVQAYIAPEHRRKGYMRKFWRSYIEKTHYRFCMLILHSNTAAKTFWTHLFETESYIPLALAEVGASIDHQIEAQYGYGPKEKRP